MDDKRGIVEDNPSTWPPAYDIQEIRLWGQVLNALYFHGLALPKGARP